MVWGCKLLFVILKPHGVRLWSNITMKDVNTDEESASEELPSVSGADTRTEITRLAARGYVQLRHVFVQLPDGEERGSTVGLAVHERRHRALLLYILLLTCWPWLANRREPLPADVWIRALTAPGGLTWSASTLSRAWADLVNLGVLVSDRKREHRARRVVPRREDGAAEYDPPAGRTDRFNSYFIVPDSFWTEEVFAKLTLPGLAMLLIIAKETNAKQEVWLTYDKGPKWYGLSPKSVQNGIADLVKHNLVHIRTESIKAPLSKTGTTTRTWYSLTGDFGYTARAALRKRTSRERAARLAKNVKTVADLKRKRTTAGAAPKATTRSRKTAKRP